MNIYNHVTWDFTKYYVIIIQNKRSTFTGLFHKSKMYKSYLDKYNCLKHTKTCLKIRF